MRLGIKAKAELQEFKDDFKKCATFYYNNYCRKDSLYISYIYVRKPHRGKGVGSHLLRYLTDWADTHQITLTLTPGSPESDYLRLLHFYMNHGFVPYEKDTTGIDLVYYPKRRF